MNFTQPEFIVKRSFYKRACCVISDSSLISFCAYSMILPIMKMSEFLLGDYYNALSFNFISTLILALIPISYLVSMTYYYFFYNRAKARTPMNFYYKNCVVPKDFVFNEQSREFKLTQSQVLKRSFAMTLTIYSFFIPNLIALADPNFRGFADYISDTITISEEEFYKLFTSKVTTQHQIKIDIESLEIMDESSQELIAA